MELRLEITGTTDLLCPNIALGDPDNPWTQQIAEITKTRSKTEDDRRQIERLEWFGGLYVENGRAVMPTGNLRKSIIDAGKMTRDGTTVARALSFLQLNVPIAYPGPDDLTELVKDPAYTNRTAVGVSGKR